MSNVSNYLHRSKSFLLSHRKKLILGGSSSSVIGTTLAGFYSGLREPVSTRFYRFIKGCFGDIPQLPPSKK